MEDDNKTYQDCIKAMRKKRVDTEESKGVVDHSAGFLPRINRERKEKSRSRLCRILSTYVKHSGRVSALNKRSSTGHIFIK